jgi:hypothetical protein
LQDAPKFTRFWIFGLKTNHLATLIPSGYNVVAFKKRKPYLFLQQINDLLQISGLSVITSVGGMEFSGEVESASGPEVEVPLSGLEVVAEFEAVETLHGSFVTFSENLKSFNKLLFRNGPLDSEMISKKIFFGNSKGF